MPACFSQPRGATVLVREIGWVEPALAVAAWADAPYLAWLDSAAPPDALSRYSYIAAQPFNVLTDRGGGDPFGALQAELARWRLPPDAAPVPFSGGAVGFLGYGLAARLEALPQRHEAAGPNMVMAFYDVVLAFDRVERRAWVISSGFPAAGAARLARAEQRAAETLQRLQAARPLAVKSHAQVQWAAEIGRADYHRAVQTILNYIRAGDIFQANFTTRFAAARPAGASGLDLYLALRAASPAPFGAYLECGDGFALASGSPERFISLSASGKLQTRPIKGTRPRGATPEQDDRLRNELAASGKDQAENLMIADLMRSDLGRVAALGSVAVQKLGQVESFAHVHHLVSVISAQLREGLGPVDVLRATFPAGSVTGAPKLRAMEIIDEVETAARGAYCGVIGWIGFDGAMDTSVTIRTLAITPERLIAQAGGGIVAESIAAEEYEEMLVKIRPLLRPFGPAPE